MQSYEAETKTLTLFIDLYDLSKEYMNVTKRVIIINVGELENNAFREWPLLTTVIIGETVETINNGAYASCKKLEYVPFQDKTLSSIGDGAFYECISLINVTIHW